MSDDSRIAFVLRAQSELLAASLHEIPDEASKQRKAITRRLSETFVDLVNRLDIPLVLEIGANEGSFSKSVKKFRPKTRVVAFEAHPLVYARHASAMKEAGVEYLQFCVADREGDMILKVPKKKDEREKLGMGSLLYFKRALGPILPDAEYPVKAVTLDGFLGDASGLANAMWIDVEGGTAHVLAGAERALHNCQAIYVELESSAQWEGQMVDADVVSCLAIHGLKPVLRDIQRHWQYNAIFVR